MYTAYFFLQVILNGSEESHRRTKRADILFTLVVGYFAFAQYDVKSPIGGVAATSPEGGSDLFVVARKRSDEAISREGGFP